MSAVEVLDVSGLALPPKGDAADWLKLHPNATSADLDALPVLLAVTQNESTTPSVVDNPKKAMTRDEALVLVRAAISAAAKGDAGAPFEHRSLAAFKALHAADRAEFVRQRAALKKANKDVSVTGLDTEILEGTENRDKQCADQIVDMARARCELFHDQDKEPYAAFDNNGHRECWHVRSKGFNEWLSFQIYQAKGEVPSEFSIKAALATLAGHAKFEGKEKPVYVRVAFDNGTYYIDLCNDAWSALEVTNKGWRVVSSPAVMFSRSSAMRALPEPTVGGDLSALWLLVNIHEDDRHMTLTWMLECLRPQTPNPVLEVGGEQGTAKSGTQSVLRDFIDPNQVNNRAAPKSIEDLFVSARNAHLVSLGKL